MSLKSSRIASNATSHAAVIELHLGQTGRIERDRLLARGGGEQLSLWHEQKLGGRIDESPDEPGAGHTIDLTFSRVIQRTNRSWERTESRTRHKVVK